MSLQSVGGVRVANGRITPMSGVVERRRVGVSDPSEEKTHRRRQALPEGLRHAVICGSCPPGWVPLEFGRMLSRDLLGEGESAITAALADVRPSTGVLLVYPDAADDALESSVLRSFGLIIICYPDAPEGILEQLAGAQKHALVQRTAVLLDCPVPSRRQEDAPHPTWVSTDGIVPELATLLVRGAMTGATSRVLTKDDLNHAVRTMREDIQQVSRDSAAVSHLYDTLGGHTARLSAGGWAASYETLALLTDVTLAAPGPLTVVEFGSGASTLAVARCLEVRARAGDRLVSVEHDARYLEETLRRLRLAALEQYAELVLAQLAGAPGESWYDMEAVVGAGVDHIDLAFVDGPPRALGQRRLAAKYLAERLRKGATLIVDDVDDAVVEEWLLLPEWARHDLLLEVSQRSGRSVLLTVRRSDGGG